ncbi:hypothetical protein [uncultured Draconibacterium sp.]|uniref:hypothetical protein n=1 Tax=uncultured Draconibacterium sp. TaxID=1573823 RepID=UPI0025EDCCE2|nr:hypothetical protein [uncultured Draconibacterium sp.]
MKRKFELDTFQEKEFPLYGGYNPDRKRRDFHTEDHFIVPWELKHEQTKKVAKVWE